MLTELVHEDQLSVALRKAYPDCSLQSFIEYYCETSPDHNMPIRFLPNVAFTIRFNLGGSFRLYNGQSEFNFDDHVLIPSNHTWIDEGKFFVIKFRFGLLNYVLGASHKEYPLPVSLRGLLCDEYITAMEMASSFEERVALSKNYFTLLYEKNRKEVARYRVVEEMVDDFNQQCYDAVRIEERLKQNYVSSKSLQRYFIRNFGITPKAVYCILRVRRALETYFSRGHAFRLHDFDYYDYSHFYKEVRKVVGVNLQQLKGGEAERDVA